MTRWLFDTDHVSLNERGHPLVRQRLELVEPDSVVLETVQFCATVSVIPFDLACERKFQELRAQRIRVGSQDLRIASTALVHSLVLVTGNLRDFERVPGLSIEDWSRKA